MFSKAYNFLFEYFLDQAALSDNTPPPFLLYSLFGQAIVLQDY